MQCSQGTIHPPRRHGLSTLPLPMHSPLLRPQTALVWSTYGSTPEPNCSRRRHTLWPHVSLLARGARQHPWPPTTATHKKGLLRGRVLTKTKLQAVYTRHPQPCCGQGPPATRPLVQTTQLPRLAQPVPQTQPVPPTKWTPAGWCGCRPHHPAGSSTCSLTPSRNSEDGRLATT